MSNMSYCRFQNTVPDMQDCLDALRDAFKGDVSKEELKEAKRLRALCLKFIDNSDWLEEA